VGPTGVGKNRLALHAAGTLNATIVNIDSVQTYAGVDIGANKPSLQDFKSCPHELYGFVPVGQKITASQYVEAAESVLARPQVSHFIFVGGSGFYVQALEKGMFSVDEPSAETLQQIAEWKSVGGVPFLQQKLAEVDQASAERIHSNDHYRIERALEIVLTAGQSLSELQNSTRGGSLTSFKVRKVGLWLEKEKLVGMIRDRTEMMLEKGLIEETESLLRDAGEEWPPLSSIGYLECRQFMRGELSRAELSDRISQNTMKLVKKQMTWFKRDPQIRWFNALTEASQAQNFLNNVATPD
jgi:tRNA dimethylallyltransferase